MATTYDAQRACLDKARASGGALNGLIPHLFSNNVVPTPGTPIASLTEAAFDGYTLPPAITWGQAYVNEAVGQAEMKALVGPFVAADGNVQETEFGVFLKTAAGGSPLSNQLFAAALFNAPVQIINGGDGVSFVLVYRYDGTLLALVDTQ